MGTFLRRMEDSKQQQQQQLINPFRKSSVAVLSPSKNYSFKELLDVDNDDDAAEIAAAAEAAKSVGRQTSGKKMEFLTFRDAVEGVKSKYGNGR